MEAIGHDAVWLPDDHLLFAARSDIFLAEHDGRNAHKLLSTAGNPSAIRLSPDGSRIRFTVAINTVGVTALWEARANGGDPHLLLSPDWNNPPQECCGNLDTGRPVLRIPKYS
jgi:Tol biopolymer transport system component